jgi:hypothetical protein
MKFSQISATVFMSAAIASSAFISSTVQAQQSDMTFFVTSVGSGKGADLGGLQGADAHCAELAKAAGSTKTNWHAYLSATAPTFSTPGVNARDRIGKGPWQNAKGVVIAKNVADLHSASNNLNKQTALTEKGEQVNGRGDPVNMHDMLTGSDPDGYYSTASGDTTCSNWTSSGEGATIVGHHDRQGANDSHQMHTWNSAHGTRGCSQDGLKSTGGAGLFYCFVAN